jgi:hypothetical protein
VSCTHQGHHEPHELCGRGFAYDSAKGNHAGGRAEGAVNEQWYVDLDGALVFA